MARASAEDLRGVLPRVNVPTLLVYGDNDVRAPLDRRRAPPRRDLRLDLVVLPGAGHVCNIEAPEEFNTAVRGFLRETRD